MNPHSREVTQKIDHWLRGLDFLWLEVTPKCNLHCIHCYANSSPNRQLIQKIQFEDWMRLLDEAYVLGCRKVQFIGGEPTLYPHLSQQIAHAYDDGYEYIEVFTNGTLINDSLLENFCKFSVKLAFSFYASHEDIHDLITMRKGSFLRTLKGIKSAIDAGLSVRVGIIAMQANSGDIEQTKTLLTDMGIEAVGIDRIRGIGRGVNLSTNEPSLRELCGNCWQGKLCIDSNGQVFPCVFARFCQVGFINDGLRNILNGNILREFRDIMYRDIFNHAHNQCWPDPCAPSPICMPACQPMEPGKNKNPQSETMWIPSEKLG